MTSQRTFKRRVRERMAKTGESYTAARRVLIAGGDRPEAEAPAFAPPTSDAAATLEVTVTYRPAGSPDSRVVKFQRSSQ